MEDTIEDEEKNEVEGKEKKGIIQKVFLENGSFDYSNAKKHVVINDEMN